MSKRPLLLRVVLSFAAGILITIGGCAEHPSTVTPESEQLQQVRLSASGASALFSKGGSDEVSQVIGPEGGTLSIPGGHSITFPAGALSEPTEIKAKPDEVFIEVEFGPHGTQFPAGYEPLLTLSYANAVNVTDPGSLVIAYKEKEGALVTEVLATQVDLGAKTVSAEIQHFSRYAMGAN